MKAVKVDLGYDLEQIEVHTFADIHRGDVHCDIAIVRERIQHIKNTPNAFAILNGDIMNNATKTAVSDTYAEEIPPMTQLNEMVELFSPIKDKILAVTSGNHENRTYIKEGIDLTAIACKQLGIYDRYCKTAVLLFLRFGKGKRKKDRVKQDKQCYTIYITHGSGGGRKEGSKVIRLADMASIVDADIYIHSHTHLPIIMKQAFYRTDRYNSTFAVVDKLFVNTSAALNYGGYGEAFEYKPASKDTPVIYLCGTKKDMTAIL